MDLLPQRCFYIVIKKGRVIDPETRTDAIANVDQGVRGGIK